MAPLDVQVWSDIACPWCWIGKRRLERALALAPDVAVRVEWRSFELDPSAPAVRPAGPSYAERLAAKYGVAVGEGEAMIARMTSVAAADGLEMRFDRVRPGSTFDAHRLLHLARERGVQADVKERLFAAYLRDGEAVGDRAALARLASETGIDAEEARRALDAGAYADAVRADEEEARRLGIHAVPFYVLAGRYGVSGAQPPEVLAQALRTAAGEGRRAEAAQGDACGPDGCELS